MASEEQLEIQSLLESHSIKYIPKLAHVFGNVNVAIVLSQLLYWSSKGWRADGYFYKTVEELYLETGLSVVRQRNAIKKLIEYQVVDYKRITVPAKRGFKVNLQMLRFIITRYHVTGHLVTPEEVIKFRENDTAITKNTQRNTQKKNNIITRRGTSGGQVAGALPPGTMSLGEIFESTNFDTRYRRNRNDDEIHF